MGKTVKIKINILGEEWTIDDSVPINTADGQTDKSTRSIHLCANAYKDAPDKLQDLQKYKKTVTRHEVIHAILHECGVDLGYGIHNENTVDWIATIYPKMKKIFKKLDIED